MVLYQGIGKKPQLFLFTKEAIVR